MAENASSLLNVLAEYSEISFVIVLIALKPKTVRPIYFSR
jgi:hypothetical protein